MRSGFLAAHARRSDRTLLRLGLVLTLVGVGLAALFAHWFPALAVVPGLGALAVWLRRRLGAHPVVRQLARFGDPARLAAEVDREFAGAAGPGPFLGPTWLAQPDTYGVHLVPWAEVAWLYVRSEVREGLRATHVRVVARDGVGFVVPTPPALADGEAVLAALHAHAPWAEVGYTPEREAEWRLRRADFVRRVDARRAPAGA